MGGQSSSTTNKASSTLPKWATPYYRDILDRATRTSREASTAPYTGRFTAPGNEYEQAALKLGSQAATNVRDYSPEISEFGLKSLRGDFLRPESNPFIEAQAQAVTRPIYQRYGESLVPGVNDLFRKNSAYGGSRRDVSLGQLDRDTQQQILDTRSQIFGQNYAAERGYQQQAPEILQMANQASLVPAETMARIAEYKTSMDQREIDNALAAFEEKQNAAWRPLQPLLSFYGLDYGRNQTGTAETKSKGTGLFGLW